MSVVEPPPTAMDQPAPPTGMSGSLAVIGVATLLRKRVDDKLSAVGLSVRHLAVLGHVGARPGVSISDLARRVDVTVQSMHATVHELIRAGSVTSDGPLSRGRSGELRLTPAGRARLHEALAFVEQVDRELGLDTVDTSDLMRVAFNLSR